MSGTFPGTAGTQQQDLNGDPLRGGQLSVFNGGTVTLAACFQDIGLAIPGPNPMSCDDTGRLPLFFVADGTYRVRLTDASGSTANGGFDYIQVPSIGASSSGGGGSAVDPTTVLSTGDIKHQLIAGVISGFVRMNGRTVGSATSGASERASADTSLLFAYLWTNFSDTFCPVLGGRGLTAAADFAANKQITMPDMRGRGLFGLDAMGNAAASRLAGATFGAGGSSDLAASPGGEGAHQLTVAELAAHNHGITDPGHTHPSTSFNNVTTPGAGVSRVPQSQTDGTFFSTNSAVTGITINNSGGGNSHNTMPPFLLGTWYMKL